MPRLPRIEMEGAIYYVTSKAIQNEEIFKDKDDYKMYLELVSKYKSQHKFKLFSYCLLPNKLELLIETGDDASISEIMHDLNSLYTKYYNGRYQKRGHLFESRFRSVLVEKAHFLVSMTRHVHLSPWRHEKTYSTPAKDYPYSSFHVYLLQGASASGSPDMNLEISEVLSFLRSKDDSTSYEKYVLEGDKKEIEFMEKSLRRGQVLGSDSFQQQVRNRVREHTEERKDEMAPRKTSPTFLFLVGGLVILATASSVYLYISKAGIESKYKSLLMEKEEEFAQKAKFENRSPLALEELEGTVWQIEMISLPAGSENKTLSDRLHFTDGKFYSEEGVKLGFAATNFTLTKQPNGSVTWETLQSNSAGETVSWRGDWQGDVMKGVVSFTPAGKAARDFSFFSRSWSYAEGVQ